MAVSVGDQVPDVEAHMLGESGRPEPVQTGEVLGSGKVVLFAVPGAFTPGCSLMHIPGFVDNREALAAKGVDKVVCTSTNDAWVLDAWAKDRGAEDIVMLSDGNGAFSEAMGLTMQGNAVGLGARSMRYAAIIEDGVFTAVEVDASGGIEASSCDNILSLL